MFIGRSYAAQEKEYNLFSFVIGLYEDVRGGRDIFYTH